MESLDILVMFPCHKGNKASAYKSHEYFFFRRYCEFILHDINKGFFGLKEINNAHHFVLMMTTSLHNVSLFCIFLLALSSFQLYLQRFVFQGFGQFSMCQYFLLTLKLLSLSHFNKIYFLGWSRYLFNNIYIVRSSLVILYLFCTRVAIYNTSLFS